MISQLHSSSENTTQCFFLAVLRFYFRNDVMPDAAGVDWAAFDRLCRIHNVEGIVYSALKASNVRMPQATEKNLKRGFLAAVSHESRQAEELELFERAMEDEEIPYILFKGVVIKDLYPEPELRTMGDIDILVHEQDIARCHRIMSRLGYVRQPEDNAIPYVKSDIRFEIHSRIDHAMQIPSTSDDLWKRTKEECMLFRMEFEPQTQLILMLDHMAKHAFRGFGTRMLMDIVVWQIRYPAGINPEIFISELNRLRILEFSKRIFELCHRMFGTKSPLPDYVMTDSTYETLRAYILKGGVFGWQNPDFIGVDFMLARKYILNKSAVLSRLAVLLWLVFPPYAAISSVDYTYLKGRPYLLPIAWIHRAFNKLSRSQTCTLSSVRGIINGSHGNNLKILLCEFGL